MEREETDFMLALSLSQERARDLTVDFVHADLCPSLESREMILWLG